MAPGKLWKTRLADGLGGPADDRDRDVHKFVCTLAFGREFLAVENVETDVVEDTDPPRNQSSSFQRRSDPYQVEA
jgi:hypothetical protein